MQEIYKAPYCLLHRDVDYLSQKKPEKEERKEQTHVSTRSVSEQVLFKVFLTSKFQRGQTNVSRIRAERGGHSLELKYTNECSASSAFHNLCSNIAAESCLAWL